MGDELQPLRLVNAILTPRTAPYPKKIRICVPLDDVSQFFRDVSDTLKSTALSQLDITTGVFPQGDGDFAGLVLHNENCHKVQVWVVDKPIAHTTVVAEMEDESMRVFGCEDAKHNRERSEGASTPGASNEGNDKDPWWVWRELSGPAREMRLEEVKKLESTERTLFDATAYIQDSEHEHLDDGFVVYQHGELAFATSDLQELGDKVESLSHPFLVVEHRAKKPGSSTAEDNMASIPLRKPLTAASSAETMCCKRVRLEGAGQEAIVKPVHAQDTAKTASTGDSNRDAFEADKADGLELSDGEYVLYYDGELYLRTSDLQELGEAMEGINGPYFVHREGEDVQMVR